MSTTIDFRRFSSLCWKISDPAFDLVNKENILSRDEYSFGVLSYVCIAATEQQPSAHAFVQPVGHRSPKGVQHCIELGGVATLELNSSGIRTSPLHHAAMCGHLRIIRLLLDHGIPVDIMDNIMRTPLSCAIQMGKLDVCRLLVDAGAQTDKLQKGQKYPICDWCFPPQRKWAREASIATLAILRCGGKISGNGKNVLTIIARCVWESRGMKTWADAMASRSLKQLVQLNKRTCLAQAKLDLFENVFLIFCVAFVGDT